MSSDDLYQAIGGQDLELIRTVLRQAGFQYEGRLCALDIDAARFVMAQYQQGMHDPDVLRLALEQHAETTMMDSRHSRNGVLQS